MKKDSKNIFPKGFFSQPRPTISSKEALKDVIPVNWKQVLKGRINNKDQVVLLKKAK